MLSCTGFVIRVYMLPGQVCYPCCRLFSRGKEFATTIVLVSLGSMVILGLVKSMSVYD